MPALIGYLLTIAVFLGGGYAGMQWMTAPQDIPSAVAVHGSVEPVKSTRARLLARKRHEEAAEREANAKPIATAVPLAPDEAAPPIVEPDAVTARAEPVTMSNPVQREEISKPAAVADKSVEVSSASEAAAIIGDKATIPVASVQPEVPLDNRATATAGITAPTAAPPQPIAKSKSGEKKTARSISPVDSEKTESKRESTAKRHTTRLASRKPVMMILRTIEFPDGRREQRLLPMPRYRQAFADDSDD